MLPILTYSNPFEKSAPYQSTTIEQCLKSAGTGVPLDELPRDFIIPATNLVLGGFSKDSKW